MLKLKHPAIKYLLAFAAIAVFLSLLFLLELSRDLDKQYLNLQSFKLLDRNQTVIFRQANASDYYNEHLDAVPENFERLLLKKEDRFFYWHFGLNPVSALKALASEFGFSNRKGSSTITQQTAKILLAQENSRNPKNKIVEAFYSLGLETAKNKEEILLMYANSAYFGNRLQGLGAASLAYFNSSPENLTSGQILQLLSALSAPSENNPLSERNIPKAQTLALALNETAIENAEFTSPQEAQKNLRTYLDRTRPPLELASYIQDPPHTLQTTIDWELNEKMRKIAGQNLALLETQKAKNTAIAVLSLPRNEILALVGSPDPQSFVSGYQIDMLDQPRQIGSTIKPFIYLKAFGKGMRPYTIIDDREYKYASFGGFSIYPKNYDYQYRGKITAHYALSNSINVAAVKALEYAGLEDFSNFLLQDLGLKPFQDFENYQMGIALGALEMDALDLARYYTIFPNEGRFSGLRLFYNEEENQKYFFQNAKQISGKNYVSLVNKILSDRKTAMDQFGMASDLNLPFPNYALKTGTSHDYTDSWIVGYTPDFLVAVWVGNADASAMEGVSGQKGAGRIWSDAMQALYHSPYNRSTPFDFSNLQEYQGPNGIEYGLKEDDYERSKNLFEATDSSFILSPHDGDIFIFENNIRLALKAKNGAQWFANDSFLGSAQELVFSPPQAGTYRLLAKSPEQSEEITIVIRPE